jgi:hypothetical protein
MLNSATSILITQQMNFAYNSICYQLILVIRVCDSGFLPQQMREAADRRKDLEREHADTLSQLRDKQAEVRKTTII